MKLVFLKVNQCWAFFLGSTLTDMRGQRLFLSRQGAVEAASCAGLSVDGMGKVTVREFSN